MNVFQEPMRHMGFFCHLFTPLARVVLFYHVKSSPHPLLIGWVSKLLVISQPRPERRKVILSQSTWSAWHQHHGAVPNGSFGPRAWCLDGVLVPGWSRDPRSRHSRFDPASWQAGSSLPLILVKHHSMFTYIASLSTVSLSSSSALSTSHRLALATLWTFVYVLSLRSHTSNALYNTLNSII